MAEKAMCGSAAGQGGQRGLLGGDELGQGLPAAGELALQSRDDYASGLLAGALSAAGDPAATLVRLAGNLAPGEAARLRAALDAAAGRETPS
jgi:hypothetical protein